VFNYYVYRSFKIIDLSFERKNKYYNKLNNIFDSLLIRLNSNINKQIKKLIATYLYIFYNKIVNIYFKLLGVV